MTTRFESNLLNAENYGVNTVLYTTQVILISIGCFAHMHSHVCLLVLQAGSTGGAGYVASNQESSGIGAAFVQYLALFPADQQSVMQVCV
jgi:hypothetical protein